MPFRRRLTAPIKSDKHEVVWKNLAEDASSTVTTVLAIGVASADKDASTEVEVGSHIYGIYFEFHFSAETTTAAKVVEWQIVVDEPSQTGANPQTYYGNQRSQILKRGMAMLVRDQSTVFKERFVVSVPKKYRRMTEGRSIVFQYRSTSTNTQNACGFVIYKEFY